ncbi:hypothetical protein AMECASPLE_032099 [Ameca splendens]|uniref:Uncharacterized protein n=1 Tax=Ameca splendens TaxID=208324 RepID=A0ABV1AFH9_9TELE
MQILCRELIKNSVSTLMGLAELRVYKFACTAELKKRRKSGENLKKVAPFYEPTSDRFLLFMRFQFVENVVFLGSGIYCTYFKSTSKVHVCGGFSGSVCIMLE